MNETYYITKLKDFQKALTGHKLPRLTAIRDTPIKYIRAAEEYADYLFLIQRKQLFLKCLTLQRVFTYSVCSY